MFGEKIKQLRLQNRMTQKEVAVRLGVSDRMIGYYESEERTPPPDILKKISDLYNVSIDYLLNKKTNSTTISDLDTKILNEFHSLSPESQMEIKKLIELYKIKDMQNKNSDISNDLGVNTQGKPIKKNL